jgi:hypothetical protein
MNKCALLVFTTLAASSLTLYAEAQSREIKRFSEIKDRCHFDKASSLYVCDVTGVALTNRASKIVAAENRPTKHQMRLLKKRHKHISTGKKQAWAGDAPGVCFGKLNPDGSCPPGHQGYQGFVGNMYKAVITEKVYMTLGKTPQ